MRLGLNADPIHWEDPNELVNGLVDAGAAFAVFPYDDKRRDVYLPFATACDQGNIEPIPVFASQSMTDEERQQSPVDYEPGLMRIHEAFPGLRHIVLGNEEDANLLPPEAQHDRSWDMPPLEFRRLLRVGRHVLPDIERIAGGTVSGQPFWWGQVKYLYGAKRHAHLYAQDHNTVRDVLQAHRDQGYRIGWVLEFGWPIGESPEGEDERAVELSQFLIALKESGVQHAAVFRYSDRGDLGEQLGLVDADTGAPLQSFAAFKNAVPALK